MYKPNGEEPMTRQEEIARKSAIAERNDNRVGDAAASEVLRTAFYAALFRASAYRSGVVEASLEITR